ncbi:MAG TPA: calcium/proton exchanger [Gemmatimonadales bacterium]|nr:calcium/proton exchanger [Gemmatimonadales bacterium]
MTSPDLARILQAARDRASAARHAFVGTEHLLAAALDDPDGATVRALTAAGLTRQDGLADELLVGLPAAPADALEPPPLSRFAERAIADAEKAGGNLALVLLRAPRGRLASVLAKRGIKLQELRKALEPDRPEPPPRAPKPPKQQKPAKPAPSAPSASSAPSRPRAEPRTQAGDAEEPLRERRLPPHLDARRRHGKSGRKIPWSLILLLAVPASMVLNAQHASPLLIFGAACLGVLPLAGLMGRATEQIAERTGPTIGGLLNATFGNAAELIIAFVALRAGLVDLVKASITGSILGNLLLILGLSLVAGGVKAPILKFNRTSAGMSSAMLALAVAGLVFPAVFHALHPGTEAGRLAISELALSEAVAIILAITYGCSLLFSLHTHKSVFGMDASSTPEGPEWSLVKSVGILALATAAVVVESEILVHAVEGVTQSLGLSEVFLGLIIIPVIGNAAEHASAVLMARKGKTDLALQIALGSSTQVALLVAPILVLAGVLIGQPMNLVFTSFEVITLAVSTIVVSMITLDGESHWFEGVQLLALYAMVAAAAYFL